MGGEWLVLAGQWICEPVLWVNWSHHGTLYVETPCKLLGLSTSSFQNLAGAARDCIFDPAEYACIFKDKLNRVPELKLSDLAHVVNEADTMGEAYPIERMS